MPTAQMPSFEPGLVYPSRKGSFTVTGIFAAFRRLILLSLDARFRVENGPFLLVLAWTHVNYFHCNIIRRVAESPF